MFHSKVYHKLDYLIKEMKDMSVEMDTLAAQVKANNDVIDSATVLINGIADRILAAGADPVKLAALATELKTKDDVLAAAVVAGAPVAP